MQSLRDARRQEAAALAELLAGGQHLARLLGTLAAYEYLPQDLRKGLARDLERYELAKGRYDRASQARAIARGEEPAEPTTSEVSDRTSEVGCAFRARSTRAEVAARVERVRGYLVAADQPQTLGQIARMLGLPNQSTLNLLQRGGFTRIVLKERGPGSAVWWLPKGSPAAATAPPIAAAS